MVCDKEISNGSILHRRTHYVNPDYKVVEPFIASLPERFAKGEGEVIYKGRNEIRKMNFSGYNLVIKAFTTPNIINRFAYGIIRGSKAKRSYLNAKSFLEIGVGTPIPIGYLDTRKGLLLDKSYYVSLLSECENSYMSLFDENENLQEAVCREIGRITAKLHNKGFLHKDYSRGNILFKVCQSGEIALDIVDLNRMRFGNVDMKDGCKNFERLPATPQMQRWFAIEYASARNFNEDECFSLIEKFRKQEKIIEKNRMLGGILLL